MGSPLKSAGALLLLMTVLSSNLALTPSSYSLDPAVIREVLTAAMKCQSIRQLHAAAVHRDSDVYSVKLELQPDGQVRDIPDTEQLLLYMASVSKGIFGTALVRVEQHLRTTLGNQSFSLFNTPIKQLLRDENFWFLDHIRSDMVTIDDLVSHRTGLARHDAMWFLYTWQNKEDLVNHVSRLKASGEFRNSFIYNNLVWTLADHVVQKLTNRSFVQYMREFLWHPLGMRDTHGSSEMTRQLWDRVDFSQGYRPMGLPLPVSLMERSTGIIEAAGGILGSLSDMMKYMKLHARQNYSAYQQVPGQFKAVNAHATESGFNVYFNPQLYNDSLGLPLPEWDIESYTRGWMRTWYRGQLDYSHGGSLLGVRCELDVFAKRNLAVLNHMTLGPATSPYQSFYAAIINKYLSDLLIFNQSFVTKDNVCLLFKDAANPGPVRIQRRQLTNNEVDSLKGSYGNYGFGKVELSYNQTSRTMTLAYGLAVIELIPLQLNQREPYYFFLNLLEPMEYSPVSVILNRTDDAIYVPIASQQSLLSYFTVRRDTDGKLVMESATLETGMLLRKDLDPKLWTRPRLCKPGSVATPLAWLSLMLMAAGASSAFGV